jgi:hypothetical protein
MPTSLLRLIIPDNQLFVKLKSTIIHDLSLYPIKINELSQIFVIIHHLLCTSFIIQYIPLIKINLF